MGSCDQVAYFFGFLDTQASNLEAPQKLDVTQKEADSATSFSGPARWSLEFIRVAFSFQLSPFFLLPSPSSFPPRIAEPQIL